MKTKISDNTRQHRTIRQRHPGTLFRASMLTMVLLCAAAVICGTAAGAVDVNVNRTGWWNATDDTTFHAINPGQIQAAIGNATTGDTIYVWNGSYSEGVDIATAHLTLAGEGADVVTVTAVNPPDHVFEVTADYVNISGFAVTGAAGDGYAGIYLNGVDHCNIYENNCSNNNYGIYMAYSSNNTLIGNNCSNNFYGIRLHSSSNNMLADNNCSNHSYGIRLHSSSNNTLTGNIITSNKYCGIRLSFSSNNTLTGNSCSNNSYGICMWSSSSNMLADNNCSNNLYGIRLRYSSSNNTLTGNNYSNNSYGIWMYRSSNNTLLNNTMSGNALNFGVQGVSLSCYVHNIDTNNTVDGKPIYYWVDQYDMQIPGDAGFVGIVGSTNITVSYLTLTNNLQGVLFVHTENSRIENVNVSNNGYGIRLHSSSNNNLTNNIITSNKYCGIQLSSSSDNRIYNNYFNNYFYNIYNHLNTTANAYDDGSNQWHTMKTNGTNIIGGPFLGGNYWSDYAGADNDGDGLGDTLTPYNSAGNIQNGGDYLPLIEADSTPPTASFTFSPSHPVTGQIVSFDASGSYDPDGGNITGYWWNISGTVYTIPGFNHAFTTPGLKYCCLIVTDDDGDTNESIKWINVNATTETPTMSIESAEGSVGDTVNVSINITNASAIAAMTIYLTYDPNILNGTGVTNGTLIKNLPAPLVAYYINPGGILINTSFVTYPDAINGDGELFVVTFDVIGGDAGESSILDIEADAYTVDVPPQHVHVDTTDGLFVVTGSTVSFDPLDSTTSIGQTTTVNLTLGNAPYGLSGYNLTVSLSDPSIAEILSVSFPTWATMHSNSTLPADSVRMKAADLMSSVGSGDTNIPLGTLTIRGDADGVCDIVVMVTKMDDDQGNPINPGTVSGTIEVTSVIPLPGQNNPPTDPDHDGAYEDLNGNGNIDFDDVVQYFTHIEWIEANEPFYCFDFNHNGRIDFDDVVELFGEV